MTLTIAELDAHLRKIDRPPYGFFVSQATHDNIVERWRANTPALVGGVSLPRTYSGLQIAVDPRLPDDEMLLAQTEAAWRQHLAEIQSTPRLIACLGEFARIDRIETALECSARDRRLVIVRSDDDAIQRLRGLRGAGVVYVDMGASWYQRSFCKLREIREASIEEARELLKTSQERIPER